MSKRDPIKVQHLIDGTYQKRSLAKECVILKNKLAKAGLYQTMHLMDEVTKSIGWEIAGQPDMYFKMKKADEEQEKRF